MQRSVIISAATTGLVGGACFAAVAALGLTVTGGANERAQAVDPPNLGIPVGLISPYSGSTAPDGWLKADGGTFDAATYPDLAAVLGGNTLPDLRGQFLRGWSTSSTQDPAGPRAALSTQSDALGSHTHTYYNGGSASMYDANFWGGDSRFRVIRVDGNTCCAVLTSNPTGGAETRPVNTAVTYIIRATT